MDRLIVPAPIMVFREDIRELEIEYELSVDQDIKNDL